MKKSLFESIKNSLKEKETAKSSGAQDLLRYNHPDNTFVIRLLPFVKDPEKTFFHYFTYGFISKATGQYIVNASPTTYGEKDPIATYRWALWNNDNKEEAGKIRRKENFLVNVLVVKDPVNPENDGTVKKLRFGKQIHGIIMDAIEGEDADEFGERIFDLSEEGCNFKLKVESQGEFPSFTASRFAGASKIKGMTDERMQEVYDTAFDLEESVEFKSFTDLEKTLSEHFLTKNTTHVVKDELDDDTDDSKVVISKVVKEETNAQEAAPEDAKVDEEVEKLLLELENDDN
tara:strand:+ start:2687 stop:3553 length:867 start_codon:yes stop_codon:yes gene_type:complete